MPDRARRVESWRTVVDDDEEFARIGNEPARPIRETAVPRNVDRARDVSHRIIRRAARVDHDRAMTDHGSSASADRCDGRGKPPRMSDRRLIHPLHLREVLRRIWLPGEHLRHELVLGLALKRPVESPLVAERAVRNCADAFAARRSRAMPRPDLQPVGLRVETSAGSDTTSSRRPPSSPSCWRRARADRDGRRRRRK